jgi:hypothetical protein
MNDKIDLYELVTAIAGPIAPTGSHGVDMDRLKNLDAVLSLTEDLLDDITRVAANHTDHRDSVARLGTKARAFLDEIKKGI